MPFGDNEGSNARTQQDLVEETVPSRPSVVEEELNLPGLQWILEMTEEELIQFFATVLKSRSNIREVDFSLGDYKCREIQSRVPGAARIHEKTYQEAARVITMALQQDQNVAGMRIRITEVNGEQVSVVHVKVANKQPAGPRRVEGKLEKGDKEFKPSLKVYYQPAM